MAKGQMKSGREPKKPKAEKKVTVTAGTGLLSTAAPTKKKPTSK